MNLSIFLIGVIVVITDYAWCCAQFRQNSQFVNVDESARSLELCAQFTEIVTAGGTLTFSPLTNDEAMSPEDFDGEENTVVVIPINHIDDVCLTIAIEEDNIFEDIEFFGVNLISTDLQICPTNNAATVGIIDTTRIAVSFTQEVFRSSSEAGVLDICINVPNDFQYERPVIYQLQVLPGGTTGAGDVIFSPPMRNLNDLNIFVRCEQVQINDDNDPGSTTPPAVEEDEFFDVTLFSIDSIDLVGGNARVIITDNDGAVVGLTSTTASLLEGDLGTTAVSFCVRLESTIRLERAVVLDLETVPLTATPGDYQELVDATLTIAAGSAMNTEVCGSVMVIGDLIREPNEMFTVQLTPRNSNDDIITVVEFRVTIRDDNDTLSDCGPLSDPLNGVVDLPSGTIQGSSALYTCNTGFEFTQTSISFRVCLASSFWTGDEPTCESVDCRLLTIPNGEVQYSPSGSPVFETIAIHTCNEGALFESGASEFNRTCQADGEWSLSEPVCNLLLCGPLDSPAEGNVDISGPLFGDMAVYTCDTGFNLTTEDGLGTSTNESFTRICQENEEWSGFEPACQRLDCGELPVIDNGTTSQPDGTEFEAVTMHSCDDGFTLLGDSTRECGIDEVWTNSEPSCADLTVSVEASSAGSMVSSGQTVVTGTALTLNGTALGVPANLIPLSKITWSGPDGGVLNSSNMTSFLELNFTALSAGTFEYTCELQIESDLLAADGGSITNTGVFTLIAELPPPPITEGVSSSDTAAIIGIAAGLGLGLLAIILCVGVLCICWLCWRRKKNYKKYVLPYRAYMDAYKNNNTSEPPVSNNKTGRTRLSVVPDISQWENGRRTHVLDAVNILDKNKQPTK